MIFWASLFWTSTFLVLCRFYLYKYCLLLYNIVSSSLNVAKPILNRRVCVSYNDRPNEHAVLAELWWDTGGTLSGRWRDVGTGILAESITIAGYETVQTESNSPRSEGGKRETPTRRSSPRPSSTSDL